MISTPPKKSYGLNVSTVAVQSPSSENTHQSLLETLFPTSGPPPALPTAFTPKANS
jgi:hypothetical protein